MLQYERASRGEEKAVTELLVKVAMILMTLCVLCKLLKFTKYLLLSLYLLSGSENNLD